MSTEPIDLSMIFMETFYNRSDIDALAGILHPQLQFLGTQHRFDNAADYIDSLRQSPPVGMRYKIIESYEKDNMVCLIYRCSKEGIHTCMSQSFIVENGLISHIRLIYDTGVLKG